MDICGNLYIKNEIFDSEIRCAGKIDSPTCRVVSSYISAKQGMVLAGLGSDRTVPCQVIAGAEEHLMKIADQILSQIGTIRETCTLMDEKIEESQRDARKTFEKMVELKIFHDRAKKTKQALAMDFKNKRQAYTKEKIKNIKSLIVNFDNRMEKSVRSLKELNRSKKKHDEKTDALKEKKSGLLPRIERQIRKLEQTLFAYIGWAKQETGIPKIRDNGKSVPGNGF